MATQYLNKICSILVIAMVFEVIFMAQTSHCNMLDVCIKHCIPNQCLNTLKDVSRDVCENACKKMCSDKHQISGVKYIVHLPATEKPKRGICQYMRGFGC
ncbi:hypothetical protein N665_0541s0028 [Sinapis alba]|nr:hypothetical protein N665_0541s0028 [Sinapis alba]